MQTKEALQFALTASDNAVMTEIDKMSDHPTQFPRLTEDANASTTQGT
jgi:hypothetical protein